MLSVFKLKPCIPSARSAPQPSAFLPKTPARDGIEPTPEKDGNWEPAARGALAPGTSSPGAGTSAGQMMLGLGGYRQELLRARTGPHAGPIVEAQQRDCTASVRLCFFFF